MKKLSFVIPCYGSEHTIEAVVDSIRETVATRADAYHYEIVLVCDASPDNVWSVIGKLCAEDAHVKGVLHAKNFGQHAAILTGFRHVSGDIVVCLDDDGQTPPAECFTLVDALESRDDDVVFAKYPKKKHSFFRNFGSKVNDFMTCKLLDKPRDLAIMSYFCCKRFIVDEVIRYNNPYPYIDGLLLRATKRISNVDVPHYERACGSSGYTLSKLLALWFNGFTAFSVKPLRIATVIGALCAGSGLLYGLYIILGQLFFSLDAPMGYSSLMAMLVFLGGMVLLMLGLIGEYIGRIYISLNNSPQAVVRERLNME